jgi:hypothetical protein
VGRSGGDDPNNVCTYGYMNKEKKTGKQKFPKYPLTNVSETTAFSNF